MREQAAEPAWVFRLCLREILDAHLEILPVCIDRAHHDFVSQHEFQVDLVRRHFELAISSSHAGQNEDPVLAQSLHAFEYNRGGSGRFKYEIQRSVLPGAFENRQLQGRNVARANCLDQVGVQAGPRIAAKRRDIQPSQTKGQGREQPDGSGAHHCRASRAPDAQTPLDFVGLSDPLLDHRSRFQKNAYLFEPLRNFDEVLRVLDIVFRQESMAQVDPSFVIRAVGRHVVGSDPVVDAGSWPPHGRDDVVAGTQLRHVGAHLLYSPEAFVSDHQVIETFRWSAVFGGVDFFVCAVNADAQTKILSGSSDYDCWEVIG